MKLKDFKDGPGELVRITGTDPRTLEDYDDFAFIPKTLPLDVSKLKLANETWMAILEANEALARLDQAARQMPSVQLLKRAVVLREAHSTSALEGTHALFADVIRADLGNGSKATPEEREILNYVRCSDYAEVAIRERDLAVPLLSEIHAILVNGTKSDSNDRGRLRSVQVLIGPKNCRVSEATFIPPPPGDQLQAAIDDWQIWVSTQKMHALVAAALAHWQFEVVHPFNDGNGRIGRLIVMLQLLKANIMRDAVMTISPWFEEHKESYREQLHLVSRFGDFDRWVRFFCEGIGAQATATLSAINELLAWQNEAHRKVEESGKRKDLAWDIATDLIGQPIITARWVSERYSVKSPSTANNALAKLVRSGVVVEGTGGNYARTFVAADVLQILERL